MTGREAFKHDLAHTLGMTVAQLSSRMTEREFRRWDKYAERKMLPQRRLEVCMAMIARAMAGGTVEDHLLKDGPAAPDTVNDVVGAIPARAFRLGQGRKKKG